MMPVLHPGPLHTGPALTLALRGPKDSLAPGARRQRWVDRHQLTWKNDVQHNNMRSYFDRHIDHVEVSKYPRQLLRPTWTVDVPEREEDDQVHRVYDHANGTFR